MAAPKGNKNAKGQHFGNAIRRAIAQDDGNRLRKIAEKLIDMAADGDIQAIREVADRLDGKPKQSIDADVRGHMTVSDKPMTPEEWAKQHAE